MRRELICGLLLFGLGWTRARACSCIVAPGCGSLAHASSMVLGTVESVRVVDQRSSPEAFPGRRRVFSVKVVEDFRGLSKPGDEIEVETGLGGGDCGYGFRLGERYLIDVYAHDGRLSTGICSKTAPEAAAGLILRELRAETSRARLPDLSGSVIRYSAETGEQSKMPTPVPDVPVTLTASDGTVFRSVTEEDGVYQIATLTPGEYTVSFQLPHGLQAYLPGEKPLKVNIPAANGAGAACHFDLNAYSAGSLEGRVVNSHGEGVAGFVSVYTHPPTGCAPGLWSAAGSTEDGVFRMGPLEAGTYWLYFDPESDEKHPWYFPGTRVPSQASPLTVKDGEPTAGLTFVVGP